MAYKLKSTPKGSPAKTKNHNRFNEESFVQEYNDVSRAFNYDNDEEEEEAEFISADNSQEEEDDSYWDSSNLLDILHVESADDDIEDSSEQKQHNRPRVYNRKHYNIENLCGVCHKTFEDQNDLFRHAKQYHPDAKVFKCQYCATFFSKLKSISSHFKRCHAHLADTKPCGYCHKTFYSQFQLDRHRQIHFAEQREQRKELPAVERNERNRQTRTSEQRQQLNETLAARRMEPQRQTHISDQRQQMNISKQRGQMKELAEIARTEHHKQTHISNQREQIKKLPTQHERQTQISNQRDQIIKLPVVGSMEHQRELMNIDRELKMNKLPVKRKIEDISKETVVNEDEQFQQRKGKTYSIEDKCAICLRKYKHQKDLIRHVRQAHGEDAKAYKCLFCSTLFSKLKSITNHYKRIHSKISKRKCCDFCGKSFFTQFLLDRHKLSHTEDRPFDCSMCDKSYKYKRNLDVHMRIHEKDVDKSGNNINIEDYYESGGFSENNDDIEMLSNDEFGEDEEDSILPDIDYSLTNDRIMFAEDDYYENDDEDDDEECQNDEQYQLNRDKESNCKTVPRTQQKTHQNHNEQTAVITLEDEEEVPTKDHDNSNTYFIIDEFKSDSEENGNVEKQILKSTSLKSDSEENDNVEKKILKSKPASASKKQPKGMLQGKVRNYCSICCKYFVDPQTAIKHLRARHPEVNFYKCHHCDDSFYSLNSLSLHITEMNHPQKRQICKHCLKSFDRRYDLGRHLKTHIPTNHCNMCSKSFTYMNQLKSHQANEHNVEGEKEQNNSENMITDEGFDLENEEVEEGSMEYSEEETPVETYNLENNDDFETEDNSNDYDHLVTESSTSNTHKCGICISTLSSRRALTKHLRRKHPGVMFFKCHHCDDICYSLESLSQHNSEMKNHRQKENVCEYCLKSFDRMIDLRRHLKMHDLARQCDICSQIFNNFDQLKVHKDKVHAIVDNNFYCSHCPRTFRRECDLASHTRIHDGRRVKTCSICDKVYERKREFMNHLKMHR